MIEERTSKCGVILIYIFQSKEQKGENNVWGRRTSSICGPIQKGLTFVKWVYQRKKEKWCKKFFEELTAKNILNLVKVYRVKKYSKHNQDKYRHEIV